MQTFKDYLIEAKFSEDDFARVLIAFERRLPKLLGTKFYRYGGPGHVESLGGSSRITYIFDSRAVGVRFKGGHVLGIDVWAKFNTDTGPSHFIDVHTLGASTILGAMKKIAELIKKPVEGSFEVEDQEISEEVQLHEMARRIESDVFYQMMAKAYGADRAQSVTWAQIKTVADDNDVLIPPYIRDQKVGRGLWNSKPGAVTPSATGDSSESEKPGKAAGKAPIMFIKITAQDPETKKFLPTAGIKTVQDMYDKINAGIEDHKPSEAEVKDPTTLFGHLAQLSGMVAKGTLKSLLVYSGPGIGKTHTVMQVIEKAGLEKGKDYVKLSGKASPLSIYQTLFMFRDGGLVVFDDLDSMWGNADATNILKAALDTSAVREIAWASTSTINVSRMGPAERKALFMKIDQDIISNPEKAKFPSQFDFKGQVIFISNLQKDEFDSAIMSRSAKICMSLTPEQVLKRMQDLLPTLGGTDVPLDKKQELVDHLLVMHKNREIDAVTMREFVKGLLVVRSGAENWKSLVSYM